MQILKTLLTNVHSRIRICEHCGNPDFYGIGRWKRAAITLTQVLTLSSFPPPRGASSAKAFGVMEEREGGRWDDDADC